KTDRLFQRDDFSGKNSDGEWKYAEGIPPQEDLESGPFDFGPGDIKFKDLNGDGKITLGDGTVNNPGDRQIIGSTTPRYQFGFRLLGQWKGFDVSTYLQGVGKREFW